MALTQRFSDYLRGYVVIRAWGPDTVRLVNELSRAGVHLGSARRVGPHSLVARLAVEDFRRLRAPARRVGARVRLVRKGGLPFVLARARRRPGLLAGLVLGAVLIAALSSRVWIVEVQGAPDPTNEALRSVLARMGVRPGAPKTALDTELLEDALLESVPDIAWADVQLVGSVARVEVRRRRDEQRLEMAPGDVVADANGLVTHVSAAAGWPVVKPGDVVRKGQVLVSGRPPAGVTDGMGPVRAAGVVYARVWYEARAAQALEMRIDRPTGRRVRGWVVRVGPWVLRVGAVEPPFARFGTRVAHHRLPLVGGWMPVGWDSVVHEEMESLGVPLSMSQAKRMAEERALELASSMVDPGSDVLRVLTETQEQDLGSGVRMVQARAVVEAVRQVGRFEPYVPAPQSGVDGSPSQS